jgi:hypothetical protein
MRALSCALALALLSGCASNGMPNRTAAKVVLGALVVGTASLAVAAAVKGNALEKDLRADVQNSTLTGRDFAKRDDEGRRWNRIGRASTFVCGLSLLGLAIVWEMGVGDRYQIGPREAPAAQPVLPPAASLPVPGARAAAQRSATPR